LNASKGIVATPWQYTTGLVTSGSEGVAFTTTTMVSRTLSQLSLLFTPTQYLKIPGTELEGVGTADEPIPPDGPEYHNKVSEGSDFIAASGVVGTN